MKTDKKHFKAISYLAVILNLLLTIESCVNKSCKNPPLLTVADTVNFIKVIPNNKNGSQSFAYKATKEYSKKANLCLIENGFDSLFIRLWYPKRATIEVIDFKNKNGKWSGELHILKTDQSEDSMKVIESTHEKISPKSGWPPFIDSIFSLGIITLPNVSELPFYTIPMDGLFLDVELATKTKYRIYTIGIPFETTDIKEVLDAMRIMKLIEKEFGIPSLDKYYFQ